MSALYHGSLVPFAVVVWPLVLGLAPIVPRWRANALWLLPLAPIPALMFAIAGAPGTVVLPDLVLGVTLQAVPDGALLIGMTAAVWTAAGWHAALTLKRDTRSGLLSGFWCLTLAGNLGVFLAADMVSFYLAFAAVSLAAWFLVVHDRSPAALAAGRVYIRLAVLGEAALLMGLVIGAAEADDMLIGSVRDAIAAAALGPVALFLLIVGFGIKAGMLPLHIWLPTAHPAAPVPGSAVLSGAIVKAGLIGMVLFVPAGSGWSEALVGAGLAGAFAAALWGLTQRNPKAVLAYSTISQMGLLLALVGAGSNGVAFYALHHGLAKGVLFLCVGLMALSTSGFQRRVVLGVAGLVALSVAGLPLTGGALAKLAGKSGVSDTLALALTLSSVTTTLVLGWFLFRLADVAEKPDQPPVWNRALVAVGALALAALALPWGLWSAEVSLPPYYPLQVKNIVDGLWPVLTGLAMLALVSRLPLPTYPPGDALHLIQNWNPRAMRLPTVSIPGRPRRRAVLRALLRTKRADGLLSRWTVTGTALFAAALVLSVLIGV